MNIFQPLSVAATGVLVCAVLTGCRRQSATPDAVFLAGAARVDITPPWQTHPSPLEGYGEREGRPAQGVHDPIFARALVVEASNQTAVVVATDLCFIPSDLKSDVMSRLENTGLRDDQLLLTATHNHAGTSTMAMWRSNVFANPRIGVFDEFLLTFTTGKISEAVIAALDDVAPALFGVTQMDLPGLNKNRRRGDSVVDSSMAVAKIVRPDGSPVAVLVNYTAHGTIIDEFVMQISGGWIGMMAADIEESVGGICLFTNGAEGDQAPRGWHGKGSDRFEQAQWYADQVSPYVLKALSEVELSGDAVVETSQRWVTLPPHKASPSFRESAGTEFGVDDQGLQQMIETLFADIAPVMRTKIGGLVIISVPGEMIGELGLQIKGVDSRPNGDVVVVAGLANSYIGYILSAEEYAQGGYESAVSFYGPALADSLLPVMLEMAQGR